MNINGGKRIGLVFRFSDFSIFRFFTCILVRQYLKYYFFNNNKKNRFPLASNMIHHINPSIARRIFSGSHVFEKVRKGPDANPYPNHIFLSCRIIESNINRTTTFFLIFLSFSQKLNNQLYFFKKRIIFFQFKKT